MIKCRVGRQEGSRENASRANNLCLSNTYQCANVCHIFTRTLGNTNTKYCFTSEGKESPKQLGLHHQVLLHRDQWVQSSDPELRPIGYHDSLYSKFTTQCSGRLPFTSASLPGSFHSVGRAGVCHQPNWWPLPTAMEASNSHIPTLLVVLPLENRGSPGSGAESWKILMKLQAPKPHGQPLSPATTHAP